MNYRTTSSKSILGKIYRDFRPITSAWEADAMEWIGEALDFIGHTSIFEKRSKALKVKDHRALLPNNLYTMRAVFYEGQRLPYGGDLANDMVDDGVYLAAKTEPLASTNTEVTRLASRRVSGFTTSEYYLLNPNYLQTSFEKGVVTVKYDAYPIDNAGFPMIPNNIYVKTALTWYIVSMMLLGGMEIGNKKISYEYANLKWEEALIEAQNDLAYPDIDRSERFRDMWVRLIPDMRFGQDLYNELDLDQVPE